MFLVKVKIQLEWKMDPLDLDKHFPNWHPLKVSLFDPYASNLWVFIKYLFWACCIICIYTKYLKLLRRYLEAENSTSPEGKVGGTTIKAQLAPRMMPWTDMRGSDKTLAENLNILEYIHRAFSKSPHKVDRWYMGYYAVYPFISIMTSSDIRISIKDSDAPHRHVDRQPILVLQQKREAGHCFEWFRHT